MCTTAEGKTSRAPETEYYSNYKLLKNNFLMWDKIYPHCAFNKSETNGTITLLQSHTSNEETATWHYITGPTLHV